jgi:hypothetical protein
VLPVHKTEKGTVIFEGNEYFSATMLAKMKISGLPKSRAGIYKHAASKGWPVINVPGKGAKDGVMYFLVPDDLIAGTNKPYKTKPVSPLVTGSGVHSGHKANSPLPGAPDDKVRFLALYGAAKESPEMGSAIDESLLSGCHAACKQVYGEAFDAVAAAVQMGYAADLYNLLVRMSAQSGGIEQMARLELNGLVEQLNVFIRLKWSRKFPPPSYEGWPPGDAGSFF